MITLSQDKLDRKNFLNKLFEIFNTFGNQDGNGLTMIINGQYGTGKSTLINFIEEKNLDEHKFNIIKYDAWENNYFDNPLVPLMYTLSKLEDKSGILKKATVNIIKSFPKRILQTITNFTNIDLTTDNKTNIFTEFDNYKKTIEEYKKVLTDFCQEKKTIFIVDELDRCLPEYQIKVLENIYHMLNIPNLIVIIALDKNQLETSIKNKFGECTDTYKYLSKFIQYEIDLPLGNLSQYVTSLMSFYVENDTLIKNIIANLLKSINLPIRDCKLLIQKLNLICKEEKGAWGYIKPYSFFYPVIVALLLAIKHVNEKIYKKYFVQEKETVLNNEKVPLIKTNFYKFLNDIQPTELNKGILYLQSESYGQVILLYLINMFDKIKTIDENDLSSFIHRNTNDVTSLINGMHHLWYFPENRNSLIQNLEIII